MRQSLQMLPKKQTAQPLLFQFPELKSNQRNFQRKVSPRSISPAKSPVRLSIQKKPKFKAFVFESYKARSRIKNSQDQSPNRAKKRRKQFKDEMRESKVALIVEAMNKKKGKKDLSNLLSFNSLKVREYAAKFQNSINRNMIVEDRKEVRLPAIQAKTKQTQTTDYSDELKNKLSLVDLERLFFSQQILNQIASKIDLQESLFLHCQKFVEIIDITNSEALTNLFKEGKQKRVVQQTLLLESITVYGLLLLQIYEGQMNKLGNVVLYVHNNSIIMISVNL